MTEQNVYHIQDVIEDYNREAKQLIEWSLAGVHYLRQNEDGSYVPDVPDNVLIFPATRSVQ